MKKQSHHHPTCDPGKLSLEKKNESLPIYWCSPWDRSFSLQTCLQMGSLHHYNMLQEHIKKINGLVSMKGSFHTRSMTAYRIPGRQVFYPSSGEICLSLSTRQGKVGEKLIPACFAKMIVIYFHCLSLNFSVNISRCVLDNASIHCLDKISVHFSQDGIVDIFQSMSQDHT